MINVRTLINITVFYLSVIRIWYCPVDRKFRHGCRFHLGTGRRWNCGMRRCGRWSSMLILLMLGRIDVFMWLIGFLLINYFFLLLLFDCFCFLRKQKYSNHNSTDNHIKYQLTFAFLTFKSGMLNHLFPIPWFSSSRLPSDSTSCLFCCSQICAMFRTLTLTPTTFEKSVDGRLKPG